MEVILKEDVVKLGSRGDVVKVAEGYGRNFLLPRKLAIEANQGNKAVIAQMKAAGVQHIFFNPSTGDYPIFDAMVDEPAVQLIKGIHEGAVVDFIRLHVTTATFRGDWYVFNLADAAIVAGVIGLLYESIRPDRAAKVP